MLSFYLGATGKLEITQHDGEQRLTMRLSDEEMAHLRAFFIESKED